MRRNNQGRGQSGRGRGCGRYQSTNNKSPEIKFYPHGSGKKGQTTTTYATVKDHIISYVQRTYRHGQDIAISLRELKKRDLTSEEPTRKISSKTDEGRRLEQDGFDMRYQAEIKQFLDRQSGLEENLMKAYALIFGTCCSKAIQSRVEDQILKQQSEMITLNC